MPSFDIDINFNLNTDGIEEAQGALENLRDTAEEANQTGENLQGASDAMGELGNKTDETNEKMKETADSSAGIGTALAGIAGGIGLDAMITTGDNIQSSWNRLSLTFDGTGVSIDNLKQKTSELSSETGRSGGEIREYFNQMGIAGVTNVDLLTSSFESLAGISYQTNKPIATLQNNLQTMTLTGTASNKMLKNLGLSTSDLAEAMGVTEEKAASTFKSLSQEERLQVLTSAMGDGAKANEMYKNSYAGLKSQAEASLAGLAGAIGSSILPIVIPALNAAKSAVDGLTSVWKGLPAPVTSVFGALGGGVVAITTVVGALGTLGKVGSSVVSGLKSMKAGYDAVRGAMGTARVIMDALRNSETITQGIRAALAIATGAETTAEGANAAAKSAAIAPTTGLAIAENSLLLPLLLLVGAIIAVVAVLYYLYNNNEMVRNGINALIAQFQAFVGTLMQVGSQIISFVSGAISNFLRWVTGGRTAAQNLVNSVYNAISTMPSRVSSALSGLSRIITKPFSDAWGMVKPYVDQIGGAINSVTGWFSGIGFGEAGYEGVGYEGFNGTLNDTYFSSPSTSSGSVVNNFNINGIIEEEASQYIVNSVNDHIKKQNLIRGV